MNILFLIAAAAMVVVGVAGTVLPILPGAPLVFAGMFLAAWVDDFAHIGGWTLGMLGGLAILALVVDVVATALGAKKVGASKWAILGATLGTVVGIFFGLVGVFLFPFIGAVVGEYLARQDLGGAGKVGVGTWLGLIFGMAAKLALVMSMLGVYLFAYFLAR